jgi:hypothetical protein
LRIFWLVAVIGVVIGAIIAAKPPPEEVGIVVFTTLIGLWALYIFVDFGWWLFKAARWLLGLIVRLTVRLFRPAQSDARTTPDRTGH